MTNKGIMISSAILALGMVLAAATAGCYMRSVKQMERVVTVRGLSEIEQPADHVIWPITYNVDGDQLASLFAEIEQKNKVVIAFLEKNGISKDEYAIDSPNIKDRNEWDGQRTVGGRYYVTQSITVSTPNVETVREMNARMLELLRSDIAIVTNNWQYQTQYLFKGLEKVKPMMIQEATENAREAANKFAEDSQSTLGKIRRATQGQLTIEDRDPNTPHIKRLRVVTTVEFYLTN